MTCGEFLARHSEYLDDELGAEAAAGMRLHMSGCARCARYDRVLRRGLQLLREAEPIQPSTDAYVGLQRYLARTPGAARHAGLAAAPAAAPGATLPRGPVAASVTAAGVLALLAWSALFRATGVPAPAGAEVALPPVQQAAFLRPVVEGTDLVGRGAPAHARAWLRAPLPKATGLPPAPPVLSAPGPYTPLLLEPPDYGQSPASMSVLASYSR